MAEQKKGGGMTVQEAGRLGGEKGGKIVRDRYGHDFYEEIGKKGGQTVARERGHAFYEEIGRKGGETVAREKGPGFYSEIGHKGGQRVRELIEEGKKRG
jgi:general stress protein YciG